MTIIKDGISLHHSPNTDHPLLQTLDERLHAVMRSVRQEEFYRELTDPDRDPRLTLSFMREVMLEIWSYQNDVNEAVFAAVGRVGKEISQQALIRSMIAVQIEEVGHGYLALQDYIAMGGDEHHALRREPSPPALALIGVVRELSMRRNPLTHLGYMYFFEKFTTMITQDVAPYLQSKGYPEDQLGFMKLHAEEDIRHADMLGNAIVEAVGTYECADEAVLYGFDCFACVYPLPLWQEAFRRAKEGV